MANLSTATRKEQVLRYLQDHGDEWVDGPDLANQRVGGSEGLKRVRELRADGHRIITRPHPDRQRDIFQYKLVTPESINPVIQERLNQRGPEWTNARCPQCGATAYVPLPATCRLGHPDTAMVVAIPHEPVPPPAITPGMAGREFPMRMTEDGTFELTKEVCVDCGGMYDDDLEHRTTNARHLRWLKAEEERTQGQLTVGVPEQPPPHVFTSMPERLDLATMAICPRCKGHRRKGREWFSRKQNKTIVEPAEDFTRDPFKPTIKGEPNPCMRCAGFGVIPQHTGT